MTPEEARRQPLAQQRSPRVSVCTLGWRDPLRWLAAGARDMRACPALSLGFGALFTAVAWLLGLSLRSSPQYALLLASGVMLLGPALAMGLIQASRSCEAGQRPRLRPCLLCWWPARSSVALFAGLLLVLELLWARSALIVFALFADSMAPEPSVSGLLLDPANRPFLAAYGAIGALFAGFAFACSVIAVPMLLDRPVDAITAALSSLRAIPLLGPVGGGRHPAGFRLGHDAGPLPCAVGRRTEGRTPAVHGSAPGFGAPSPPFGRAHARRLSCPGQRGNESASAVRYAPTERDRAVR